MKQYLIDFSNVSSEVQERVLNDINRIAFLEPEQVDDTRKYTFYLDKVDVSCLSIPSDCVVSVIG